MTELILPWPPAALSPNSRVWSKEQLGLLVEFYAKEYIDLDEAAMAIGKSRYAVAVKASRMGLTDASKKRKADESRYKKPPAKFNSDQERNTATSIRMREHFATNGHPRGALGMKHTDETKLLISRKIKARWSSMDDAEKQGHLDKAYAGRVASGGVGARQSARGSWKAGWRQIGDSRNFYRSRWEANYARYLQWLKDRGEIEDWKHEPETFWFESIKRGVRSYKPDFRVWEIGGASALHEVKGWMDSRSRTCLKRMAKYYPSERLVLVDGPAYRSIRRSVMSIIPGWEDSPRDAHA